MMNHPHVVERLGGREKHANTYRLGVSKLFMQADVLYELQNVKNTMLYPFVRRLQRWWIHLQGSILQRKYKRCAADLQEAQTVASIQAVSRVPAVAKALERGDDIKQRSWTIVCGSNTAASVEAIAQLRQAADAATQIVDEAVKRKEEAYRIRATLLAEIDGGNERCSALKSVAHGLYDSKDTKELLKLTGAAEDALAACRTELITVANEWETATFAAEKGGPRSLQRAGTLNVAQQRASLDKNAYARVQQELSFQEATAQRRQRLDAALTLVQKAEAASRAMLEKKRAMDEARAEYQAALDVTAEKLSCLKIEDFIIAGITSVSDAVANARDAISLAQRALQSIDPEPVKAAVENAASAVAEAVQVAEREAARVAAIALLDKGSRTLRDITDVARQDGLVNKHLETLIANAEATVNDARNACASSDLALLQRATRTAVDAVNSCGDYLEAEQEKQEQERQERVAGAFAFFRQRDSAMPPSASRVARTLTPRRDTVREPSPSPSGLFNKRKLPRLVYNETTKETTKEPPSTPPPAHDEPPSTPPRADLQPVIVPPVEPSDTDTHALPQPKSPTNPPPSDTDTQTTSLDIHPSLAGWLEAHDLEKFAPHFYEIAENLDDLRHLTESDLNDLVKECHMKKLTVKRLRTVLIDLGANVAPPHD